MTFQLLESKYGNSRHDCRSIWNLLSINTLTTLPWNQSQYLLLMLPLNISL